MFTDESCRNKPQIQGKQVDKNRPMLGRGRAGMQCKHLQPVADTLVSTNKLPKIPTIQKILKLAWISQHHNN